MPRARARRAGQSPTPAAVEPLAFPAALVQGNGRKCLTYDSDGEATLTLTVPDSHASLLLNRVPELKDRAFYCVIDLSRDV